MAFAPTLSSRGVHEAPGPAALIAPARVTLRLLANQRSTACGAIDLAPVAVTADQDLSAAKGAEKEATAGAFIEVAPAIDAPVNPWTRSASGAIMPLQSCSGTL